jgi:hypothetical protein
MPTIPIRNIGLQGLQKDALDFDIPASGITSGENVRIKNRSLTSFNDVIISIEVEETENLLFADGIWRDRSLLSGLIVVLADETLGQFTAAFSPEQFVVEGEVQVYFYDTTGSRTNISPASPLQTTENWHGTRNGEQYLLNNNKLNVPHSWTINESPIAPMIPLSGWPDNYRCAYMDTFKNFIVAGGISVDGIDANYRVKWSHPVSPGDTTTYWDFTDPTLLAGESPLIVDAREMVAIQSLKDLMIIYFDTEVVRMQFVGGQFVMNFETIFRDDGALSSRAMIEVDGMAYVFGRNDVYTHDGYTKRSISDGRMTLYMHNNVNPTRPVDAVFHALYNEIMFLVRTPSLSAPVDGDRIFIYNTTHDAWTETDVTNGGEPSIGLLFNGPNIVEDTLLEKWSTITQNWNETGQLTWSGAFQSVDLNTLYALSLRDDVIYDFGADFNMTAGLSLYRDKTRVLHTHIDLDEGGNAVGDRIMYVNRVYPQIVGSGVVQFRFGVHDNPNQAVSWIETVEYKLTKADAGDPLESEPDYACDFRMAGRYLAYELTIKDDAYFSYSGMDIEVIKVGQV